MNGDTECRATISYYARGFKNICVHVGGGSGVIVD